MQTVSIMKICIFYLHLCVFPGLLTLLVIPILPRVSLPPGWLWLDASHILSWASLMKSVQLKLCARVCSKCSGPALLYAETVMMTLDLSKLGAKLQTRGNVANGNIFLTHFLSWRCWWLWRMRRWLNSSNAWGLAHAASSGPELCQQGLSQL